MNKRKWLAVALLALAPALWVFGQLGSMQVPANYSGSVVFGIGGTNSILGYTNTAVPIDTSKGKELALQIRLYGYDESATNDVTVVLKRGNTAATTGLETLQWKRIGVTAAPGVLAQVITNITVGAAPFVYMSIENPNESTLTNVTVKAYEK